LSQSEYCDTAKTEPRKRNKDRNLNLHSNRRQTGDSKMSEEKNCEDLGELFGKESVWGDGYLPCSNRNDTSKGVLSEILGNNQEYEKDIPSLRHYKESYPDFCNAYYNNLPKIGSERPKYYTCVPYWGSDYWKSKKRIAIFAQKSLNQDGAGIPLYFPLCEVESWEKAFELGLRLNREQPTKPFGWQSFMSVWIAMRYIFSGNYKYLQYVYYSDIEKVGAKDNKRFLENELEIIKPDFSVLFGKKSYKDFEGFFGKHGKVSYIYFPCGQGSVHAKKSAGQLGVCKNELSKWLGTS